MITNNWSEILLNDGDISTTKPIEQYFGNLDRKLKKIGSKGFQKFTDDLVIKESWDLVTPQKYEWRTKANRIKAKELNMLRETFSDGQKELMKMNVERGDAVLLTNRNKILHCISLCKNRHCGPLTSVQEVIEMVKKYEGDNKGLNKSLNL